MAKSDLLKQAIADAKTVKETALANAKLALQEAFVPHMTKIFAEKLEAGMDLEEDEDEEGMSADAAAPAAEPADVEGGEGEDFTWTDDSLAASVGGKDYSFQVGMAGGDSPAAEPAAPSDEEMTAEYNEGYNEGYHEEGYNEGYHEGAHSDLDIDQIIRELEEDAAMNEPMTNPMDLEEDMYFEEDYPKLEKGIEDMHGGMDPMSTASDIDEIIEAILREEDAMADPTKTKPEMGGEEEEVIQAMEAELVDKEKALEEAYRTVKYLQSVINEVNLLNAKLLYTNKLFRNFELSESQKMKIIENFDRATNTREAKLVFATLAESFKRPTKKRVVKESYASKATSTTAPSKQTTQILSEGFEMANRWKKLAGLL